MARVRENEPPGVFPPVWMAIALFVALVVGFAVWLAFTFADGHRDRSELLSPPETSALECDPPPRAPSTHPTFARRQRVQPAHVAARPDALPPVRRPDGTAERQPGL